MTRTAAIASTTVVVRGGPAAGGGRWIEVAPERVERWVAGFADRHGGLTGIATGAESVTFTAGDGSVAECHIPFPPLTGGSGLPALVRHTLRDRRIGVLLVRLGGYAAGVFEGGRLVTSKVGSRQVHGRSAAGGQSQQRFARRRDKQAREALGAAADVAARVLVPYVGGDAPMDAVVLGGDRHAIGTLREDRRLAGVFALAVAEPFLAVPDPRLAVLRQAPGRFRAVRIRLAERGPN
jgi:Actinobacteria/chloroflexi VLRF1 release factor